MNTDARSPRILLGLVLVCSAVCRSQEVKFVDLTHLHPRIALRFQPGIFPLCAPEKKPCIVDGFGGEIIDEVAEPVSPRTFSISIDRVSSSEITLAPFEVELRVVNTGAAPLEVPVWGELSDLQPADETQPFSYLSLSIVVSLSRPMDPGNYGTTGANLYGSSDRPETVAILKPGQWIRVKTTMSFAAHVVHPVANVELSPWISLQRNQFTLRPEGKFLQSTNLHVKVFNYFPPVMVNFSPTTHTAARP